MLIKRGRIWHHVVKIDGRKVSRSTGETDRRWAEVKAREFRDTARLLRKSPGNSHDLDRAIVREVARVEADTSVRESERVGQGLTNFAKWRGRTTLGSITTDDLFRHQRWRLRTMCPNCRKEAAKEKCRTCGTPTRTVAA